MALAKRVIKPETSEKMRYPDAAQRRDRHRATRPTSTGYYIGGKTGTAEKVVNGHYAKKRVLTAFTAVLPADNPRYQLLIMLDEPQPLPETHGFITSGWNAVPTGGQGDRPHRAAAGHRAALRPAAVRPPYSCGIEDNASKALRATARPRPPDCEA